ncbi:MAG TPA: FtsX-like permease family protein, partial [Vicinamibacteria bacterium]|nr:FtsX-like permease family protein [Vicinamibacteria bacterium]
VLALAWREGRASRRRGLLVGVTVAIGVAALVAINSFTDNLRESVAKEARALLGADLALSVGGPFSPAAESLLDEVRRATTPPADVARVVSFGAMALRTGGETTRLAQVLAVDPAYPYYGSIETAPPGEWARLAETGGAVADASLLVALGARVGDEIALGEARFVVRATVENAPGDVGVRSAFGPRVFVPRRRVGETALLTKGSRARYEAYLRFPPGTDAQGIADRYRSRLSAERLAVRTVSDDQRRLTETLSRFGNFLGLVALVALLLGGLGVASAVHVFIRRRMATVAVLRCLGATGGTVLAAYLVQALAVGLAGSLAGAAAGAAVQAALPRLLKGLLPVDVAWSLSWPSVLGGVGVGVWVAAAFSLLPLLAVRRVSPLAVLRRDYGEEGPPRRDLARYGAALALAASLVALAVVQAGRLAYGLAFAAGIAVALAALWLAAAALVRGLRRFFPRRLPYLWRQGLANLYRPANQTLAVVLALGFGAFLLSTLLLVQHNLLRGLRVDRGAERPNLVFFDVQPDQKDDVEARMRAGGPLTAPAVPIVPMRLLSLKGRPASELLAIEDEGQRPERWALRREYRSSYRDAPAASERVVAGAWWRPGAWKGRADAGAVPVALEAGLARELRVGIGDEIVWDVQGVPVPSRVAALREVEWARFEPNFFVVFPEGPLDDAPQSYVLLSRVDDPVRRAHLQRAIVEAHPNVSTLDLAQVQRAIEGVLDKVVVAVRFMALFSLAAGSLVLAGAVAASRYQRVREGALLRTLGARRSQLVRILLAEYAVLGALAAGAAILLSSLAGWALVRFVFEGAFALPGPALLALVLAVLGLTVAVGLAGSTEVWRRPPLEVLRAE